VMAEPTDRRTLPLPGHPGLAGALPLALAAGFLIQALVQAGLPPAAVGAAEIDPWSVLSGVRESLVAAGPTGAEFSQVYVPAGFTSGEKEAGKLALALPDCLRWDYVAPYPKSFLLCAASSTPGTPRTRPAGATPSTARTSRGSTSSCSGWTT